MNILCVAAAYVVTTASTRAINYVSQFGADLVINYNEQKWSVSESFSNYDKNNNINIAISNCRWLPSETGLPEFDILIDTVGEPGVWGRAQTDGLVKQGVWRF